MSRQRILAPTSFTRLRTRARELLIAYRAGEQHAGALFVEFHHAPPVPEKTRLADARLVLARVHGFPSWPRLKRGIGLFNALCADDADAVLAAIRACPALLDERVNGATSNWGPPLACAVQVGSARVFDALLPIPGQDLQWALGRAILTGRIEMALKLMKKGATPAPDEVMGPCESLNVKGLEFLVEIGAPLHDGTGDATAPIGLLLEGYARDPQAKHACLAVFDKQGFAFPDTPIMAFHRGRIDLLKSHLADDPDLPQRRFSHRDIYPLELGCHADKSLALHGTPLDGTTLLHMCMDFDEWEIACWLIDKGADTNMPARVEADGFGGHSALFNAVVSQANRVRRQDGTMARLLLDNGANVNARASIRKAIRFTEDESVHEYRAVTPLAYGRAFHAPPWVNESVLRLVEARGGR